MLLGRQLLYFCMKRPKSYKLIAKSYISFVGSFKTTFTQFQTTRGRNCSNFKKID